MTKDDLLKEIQNMLAYPFAWEKVGLGDVSVEKAAAFARDRSAHIVQFLMDAETPTENYVCLD